MKAVVFRGIGDIRLENVDEPKLKEPTDAIVRLTASAICGTDLHMVRGTMSGMKPGTILGHEGVGVVSEVGKQVRNFRPGDRVVICSTIGCGYCSYCRAGYYSQCDSTGLEGTAFFGGPESNGAFHGMQAEYVRVPFATTTIYKLSDEISDEEAILCSDIFPTGYMAAELADILPGRTVAVFGCGPVGQFAIASLMLLHAGRVIAVDCIPSRLDMARAQGAEVVDFNRENPVEAIKELTGGIGVDRAIDAVGVDAELPESGPARKAIQQHEKEYQQEREQVAPKASPKGGQWVPGSGPSVVLDWAVQSLAKAGTLSIIGVYPPTVRIFPIGEAMNRNLTLKMGNCNHRKYMPQVLELVRTDAVRPTKILTQSGPLLSAIDAYQNFDRREAGWVKVMLEPAESSRRAA